MKILKKALIALVALVVLLLVVSLFLPSTAHVERSRTIDAPICTVYTVLNGFEHFNEWSPWAGVDPDARYAYEGPERGVGAKMSWQSDDPHVGSGSQEIIASQPYRLVRVQLDFGAQGTADAYYQLKEKGEGTEVTWGFDTDFGYDPIGRYFGLFFDSMLGPDYEKGLAQLETFVESLPQADWCELEVEEVELEPQTIAYVRTSSPLDAAAVGQMLGDVYQRLGSFLGEYGLQSQSAPFAITNFRNQEEGWGVDAGVAIASAPEEELPEGSTIQIGEMYSGPAVKVVHTGPYSTLGQVYPKIGAYLAAHGFEGAERNWETYVVGPGAAPPEELITEIYVPVK